MFNSILVATDFSNTSNEATLFGIKLANQTGGKIYLLYVHKLETPHSLKELKEQEEVHRAFYLDKMNSLIKVIKEDYKFAENVNIVPIIDFGSAIDKILVHSERMDLVIVGSHGKETESIANKFLGSIPTNLVNNLSSPLIIFPRNKSYNIPISKFMYITKREREQIIEKKAEYIRKFTTCFTPEPFIKYMLIKEKRYEQTLKRLAKCVGFGYEITFCKEKNEEKLYNSIKNSDISFLIINLSFYSSLFQTLTPYFSDKFYNSIGIPVLLVKNVFFYA